MSLIERKCSYRSNIVWLLHDEDASISSDRHPRYLDDFTLDNTDGDWSLTDTSHQSFVIGTGQEIGIFWRTVDNTLHRHHVPGIIEPFEFLEETSVRKNLLSRSRTYHRVLEATFIQDHIPGVGKTLRRKQSNRPERDSTRHSRTLPSSGGSGRWLIGELVDSSTRSVGEETATGSSLLLLECDEPLDDEA